MKKIKVLFAVEGQESYVDKIQKLSPNLSIKAVQNLDELNDNLSEIEILVTEFPDFNNSKKNRSIVNMK